MPSGEEGVKRIVRSSLDQFVKFTEAGLEISLFLPLCFLSTALAVEIRFRCIPRGILGIYTLSTPSSVLDFLLNNRQFYPYSQNNSSTILNLLLASLPVNNTNKNDSSNPQNLSSPTTTKSTHYPLKEPPAIMSQNDARASIGSAATVAAPSSTQSGSTDKAPDSWYEECIADGGRSVRKEIHSDRYYKVEGRNPMRGSEIQAMFGMNIEGWHLQEKDPRANPWLAPPYSMEEAGTRSAAQATGEGASNTAS